MVRKRPLRSISRSIEWAPTWTRRWHRSSTSDGRSGSPPMARLRVRRRRPRCPVPYEPDTGLLVHGMSVAPVIPAASPGSSRRVWRLKPDLRARNRAGAARADASRSSTATALSGRAGPRRCSGKVRLGQRHDRREPDRVRRRNRTRTERQVVDLDPRVRAERHARMDNDDRRTLDAGTLAARTPGKHSEVFIGRICQTAHWCVRFGRDRPCLWAGPGSVGRAAPSPSRDRPRH